MNIKNIVVLAGALFLSGCMGDPEPIYYTTEYKVVEVPQELYNCPYVKIPKTVDTEEELAEILVRMKAALDKCHLSQKAVQNWLKHAKESIEMKK